MTDRIRFGLVGAGGRSDFFLRIARRMPKHFEAVCVQVRDPVKGKVYADRWQLPVVNALPKLLEWEELEFVLVPASQPTAAEVIASVATTGMPAARPGRGRTGTAHGPDAQQCTHPGGEAVPVSVPACGSHCVGPRRPPGRHHPGTGVGGAWLPRCQFDAAHTWRGIHGRDDTRLRRRVPPVGQSPTDRSARCGQVGGLPSDPGPVRV